MIEYKITKETQTKAVLKGFTHKDREEIEYTNYMINTDSLGGDISNIEKITLEITQALLAQWLLEKHGILIRIKRGGYYPIWYDYDIEDKEGNSYYSGRDESWESYQETMNEGLRKALDLI